MRNILKWNDCWQTVSMHNVLNRMDFFQISRRLCLIALLLVTMIDGGESLQSPSCIGMIIFPRSGIPLRQQHAMISSGFSFSDGDQVLVSAQKPLGIVLEQDSETGMILVTDVDPLGSAGKGGVAVGDQLVAVQNASTEDVDLDDVLDFIKNGPRVINLRLLRAP